MVCGNGNVFYAGFYHILNFLKLTNRNKIGKHEKDGAKTVLKLFTLQ